MIISNLDKERSFSCLSRILGTLKEDDHNYGLKRYVSKNENSLMALCKFN
jgi:hypothetical protein